MHLLTASIYKQGPQWSIFNKENVDTMKAIDYSNLSFFLRELDM